MNREQLAATADPGAFCVYVGGWEIAVHLEHILDYLRRVAAGELDRVLVFAPPRHGKSELLKRFVAWYLGRYPDRTVIVASYNDDLAADFGRAVRRLLNAHGKELFGISLASDSAAVGRFGIEGHHGGLYAAGIGGSLTGRGADLLIVDDVIKSDVEALSETTQRRHLNWWRSVALTRLEPEAAIVGIGTRWSVDDLLGRLADSDFEVVRLSALAEDDDPIGREPGEALWPARYPAEVLAKIKEAQGGFWWQAQYQGTPEPVSGNLFARDYFREYTTVDGGYVVDGKVIPVEDCVRFAIADTALSEKKTADLTVVAMFATTPDKELLLLERWRGRYSGPKQVKLLQRVYEEWTPAYIGIEAATPGIHLLQELQADLPIKELKPDGNKISRATTAATMLEAGRIHSPKKPWRDEWDAELVMFPHSRNDDQVDVLAYAALQVSGRRKRQSLAGWTIDPDLQKAGLNGSYSYDIPGRSPNIGP